MNGLACYQGCLDMRLLRYKQELQRSPPGLACSLHPTSITECWGGFQSVVVVSIPVIALSFLPAGWALAHSEKTLQDSHLGVARKASWGRDWSRGGKCQAPPPPPAGADLASFTM